MRATNEPKLPALTNFKSMHLRPDQSETSSQVGGVNGSFLKSPGNIQANKYYATNNSFAGRSLNLKNTGAAVMKNGKGVQAASTFSQMSMPRPVQ